MRVLSLFSTCLLFPVSSCLCNHEKSAPIAGSGGKLNIAIWSNYIGESVFKDFEAATGIKIVMSNYSSNEELLAKLQAGATGYDLIVPSDYMISIMMELKLLERIDKSKIPNLAFVEPEFLARDYDRENLVSLPYTWTSTGIGVNTEKTKNKFTSWRQFFEDPEIAGHVSMLDDVRESVGAALNYSGKSINSIDPGDLAAAKTVLVKNRARVKAYTSEPLDMLTSGDVWVAQIYSSDAMQANRNTNGKIEFSIPTEGSTLSIDNMAIPRGAKNIEAALKFINFIYQPSVNKVFVESVLGGPVVKGVAQVLKKELQTNPILFPAEEVRHRFEMIHDIGEQAGAWDRVWTEVKAAN